MAGADELMATCSGSGISFTLSEQERQLYEAVEAFGRAEVAPGAVERMRTRHFDRALWERTAAFGLTRVIFDGDAPRLMPMCLALEALQHGGGDGGFTLALSVHTALCVVPIRKFATPDQRDRYLSRLVTGEWIGGLAITEPGHGSDAVAIETAADATDEGFRLSGVKTYVTNGAVADLLIVLARTAPGALGFGLTALLVDTGTPGITVEPLRLSGYRSCSISTVAFDAVHVPTTNVLGTIGRGFGTVARACFELERSVMLASVVGEMQRCLDETVSYASSRVAHGQPIITLGQVQRRLASMRCRLDVARLALYRATRAQELGTDNAIAGPIAKKVIAEAALENAAEAIQVFGGAGSLEDGPVARALHDARLASIAGGTIELQEQALAAAMFDTVRRR